METVLISLRQDILRFAMSFTQNIHDAEDLCQTVFLKCLLNKDKLKDGTSLKNWAFMILRNEFINTYRAKKRRSTVFKMDVFPLEIFSSFTNNQETKDLLFLIDTLPYKLKITIRLRIEGYKYEEIAHKLNINLGTVKSRIFLARKFLQSNLQ